MSAEEYYRSIFNPEALVGANKDGLFDLREQEAAGSHVLITDTIVGAYHYDECFVHKKLLNPDRSKGYRQRHDFILINKDRDSIDVFLVEMKSEKDDFSHLRNQLQGGIALMAFLQRMGIDKGGDVQSFAKVKFYAVALLHTKQLPDTTNMEKLKNLMVIRKQEQRQYANVFGIICVAENRLSVSQLKLKSKQVSLQWCDVNAFAEFPM